MVGNRANQRRHRSGGSASPVTTRRRNEGSRGRSPTTSHASSAARSSDGTTSSTVTDSSATSGNNAFGSAAVSRVTTRTRPPTTSGASICQTEMSNVSGAFCTSESAATRARSSILASRWLTMPRRCTMAPLGLPVDPDVKITYARSSGAPSTGTSTSSSAPSSTTRPIGCPAAAVISSASTRCSGSTTSVRIPLSVKSSALRRTGARVSSGTYAPPAPITPSTADTNPAPGAASTPTRSAVTRRDSALARATSAAYVVAESSSTTASASGCAAACARTDSTRSASAPSANVPDRSSQPDRSDAPTTSTRPSGTSSATAANVARNAVNRARWSSTSCAVYSSGLPLTCTSVPPSGASTTVIIRSSMSPVDRLLTVTSHAPSANSVCCGRMLTNGPNGLRSSEDSPISRRIRLTR